MFVAVPDKKDSVSVGFSLAVVRSAVCFFRLVFSGLSLLAPSTLVQYFSFNILTLCITSCVHLIVNSNALTTTVSFPVYILCIFRFALCVTFLVPFSYVFLSAKFITKE